MRSVATLVLVLVLVLCACADVPPGAPIGDAAREPDTVSDADAGEDQDEDLVVDADADADEAQDEDQDQDADRDADADVPPPPDPRPLNTGHWRTIGPRGLPTGDCDPVAFEFLVPDFDAVRDATLTIGLSGSEAGTEARLVCLDGGEVIAGVDARTLSTSRTALSLDVPLDCFATEAVAFRLSTVGARCATADGLALNVKSTFRRAPLLDVLDGVDDRGLCDGDCVQQLNEDDGDYLEWVACSSAYSYGNPSDFLFDVFDRESVERAVLTLDATTSGDDARARISCVDGSGVELAEINPEQRFERPAQAYGWPVPAECFAEPEVRIRITRSGSNCLGVDVIGLEIESAAREARISRVSAAGTCDLSGRTGCVYHMNRNDDSYLQWAACSATYQLGSPTDLFFPTPDFADATAARLVTDTTASGADAGVRIACLDAEGEELAELRDSAVWGTAARTRSWDVPLVCLASETRIRFERSGSNCLGVDYVRLLTTSELGDDLITNVHAIEGYTDRLGVRAGEELALFVHAPEGRFSVDVRRYGQAVETVHEAIDVSGGPQQVAADAFQGGAGWDESYRLVTDADWRSGLYSALLTGPVGDASYATFVVSEPTPSADIVVLASTNTWVAYNSWGVGRASRSFYRYAPADESGRQQATRGSLLRPLPAASPTGTGGHLAGAERWMLEWLEREGYDYGMLSDDELHYEPERLLDYGVAIINVHSEYWTGRMYDALEAFLDAGGTLLYLSGNGVYWRSTLAGDVLETQKNGGSHTHDGAPGGLWRSLGRNEAGTLGVAYTSAQYCTSAPVRVLEAGHWIYEGTGLANGDTFGADGEPGSCGEGVSGWEMDRMNAATPVGTVLLGVGTNGGDLGAHVTWYDHAGGGGVFSGSSINWTRSLVVDDAMTQMVRNVLDR